MKKPDFSHVDTNSHKIKVDLKSFEWEWSEMGVASWSQGSKIDCISTMN